MDKSIVNRVLKTARIGLTEQKQLVVSNITNNIMIYNVCFDSIIGISNTTYEQYFKQLYAEQELESRTVFYRNAKRAHYSFESVLS
ncbi:MAG: hypothetical protein KAY50_00645 [Chitinophagaceae bacterium]|nr:hypothetical protein [Chitinophagaceae bacterium]